MGNAAEDRNEAKPEMKTPTRDEIIEYFGNDNESGPALNADYLATCSDHRLARTAELAGERFVSWLQRRRAAQNVSNR